MAVMAHKDADMSSSERVDAAAELVNENADCGGSQS